MDDAELRALLAAQARLIAELSDRLAPAVAPSILLAELYRRYEVARRGAPAWGSSSAMLRPFVARYADRDAASLDVRDWGAYRDSRAELAPSSRNLSLWLVKAMLRWGVAEGLLKEDPPLCKARTQPQKDHRETAPTEGDVTRLLAEVRQPRERVIVLCAVDSGMRRNEIRQLQWTWVGRGEIAIPNWAAKGGRGRVVPASRRQLAAVEAMPRVLRSQYVLANPETGEPYARPMLTKWWRELAALAGLQAAPGEVRVRLHDGRHGFATNAVGRGVRIEVVSEILGHASLEQTKAYVQSRPTDLAVARELFEAGIPRQSQGPRK